MAAPLTLADDPDARCGATDEDYRSMLADLLPTGPVWPRDPESNLQRLLLAMAADFARAHNRGCDLIGESVPTDASELLPDWERLIGPDPCAPAEPATLGDRRRRIVARLNYRGGQSIAIFRDLALASFGIELCFAEFRPFRAGPNGPTPGLVTGHRCQAEFYGHAGARLANNGWRFAWSICLCSGPSAPLAWLLCLIDRARPAQSLLLWDTMRPDGLEVFKHAPD